MTTLRAVFPRLALGLLIAAVAVWLAFNRDHAWRSFCPAPHGEGHRPTIR